MELIEYPDAEMMAINVANALASELRTMLDQQERVTFAVPGGSTPAPVYDDLCAASLDWDRVDLLLTDERCVPESDDRSNTAMLRRHLLTGRAAAATYHPIWSEAGEQGLSRLRKALGPVLPVDLAVLGMGGDMHTASMFPTSPELAAALDKHAPILLPVTVPDQPQRVTLTMPVLMNAISRHILITGEDKKQALKRARKLGDPSVAPIAPLLQGAVVHWAP